MLMALQLHVTLEFASCSVRASEETDGYFCKSLGKSALSEPYAADVTCAVSLATDRELESEGICVRVPTRAAL
jgi:hypothetical protein